MDTTTRHIRKYTTSSISLNEAALLNPYEYSNRNRELKYCICGYTVKLYPDNSCKRLVISHLTVSRYCYKLLNIKTKLYVITMYRSLMT